MAEVEPALPPFGERPNEAVILKTEFRVGDHQQLRKVVKCNVAYLAEADVVSCNAGHRLERG
jgi:hypothetical protein